MGANQFPFPELNAGLNGLAALLLTTGFILIKLKKRRPHQFCMTAAFSVSVLFLASYLTYHYRTGAHTPFGGEGFWKIVYYLMLISHIILAVVIIPLILNTFRLALQGRFKCHRKWAHFTFPLWYYVSLTGVMIYFFLYQWFPTR